MYRELIRFWKNEDPSAEQEEPPSLVSRQINALAWSPDSQKVATAHNDRVVRVWNVREGSTLPIFELPHKKFVVSVAWSRHGQLIATGDTKADPVHIWDANTGQQLFEHYEHYSWPLALDWSPDDTHLVSAGMDGRVLLWDTATWQILKELQPDFPRYEKSFTCVLWHPDERIIVFSQHSNGLCIWNGDTTKQIEFASARGGMGRCLAWRKTDPDKLACLMYDGTVGIWSLHADRFIAFLPSSSKTMVNGNFRCMDWSPGGHEIATAGGDQTVRIWQKGALATSFQADASTVHTLRWSPDGTMLATGGEDDILRIWTK